MILPHTANSTNSSASLNETIDQVGGILSESNGTKIVAAWKSSGSFYKDGKKYDDKQCIAFCEIIRFDEKFVKN